MTIYIVFGRLKGDDSTFVDIIKAFTLRKKADKHCGELLQKKDNPYRDVLWQQTELEELEGKIIIMPESKKCEFYDLCGHKLIKELGQEKAWCENVILLPAQCVIREKAKEVLHK